MTSGYVKQKTLSQKKPESKLPKVAFWVLIFFGIATFFLGIFKISQGVYGPFVELKLRNPETEQTITETTDTTSDLIIMQTQDTDEDGLSDYDEVYIYSTSPYMQDTDSDGYPDKQEVESDHDPVCAAGKNCWGDFDQKVIEEEIANEPSTDTKEEYATSYLDQDVKEQLNNLSVEELREMLLSSGEITKEQLDAIDDQTLMNVFQETLSQ